MVISNVGEKCPKSKTSAKSSNTCQYHFRAGSVSRSWNSRKIWSLVHSYIVFDYEVVCYLVGTFLTYWSYFVFLAHGVGGSLPNSAVVPIIGIPTVRHVLCLTLAIRLPLPLPPRKFPDLWASLVSPSRVCRFTICILSFVIWVASAAFKWLPQMILTTGGG